MAQAARLVRFGVFEVDLHSGELRKRGRKLALQEQPFRVLEALLESPGQIVTRDDLRRRLWPEGTFVEFDASLNTAVRKLRRALDDPADSPRFVETLARRGYRFIAPVQPVPEPAGPDLVSESTTATAEPAHESPRPSATRRRPAAVAIAAVSLLFALGFLFWRWPATRPPEASRRSPAGMPEVRSLAVLPLANLGPPEERYFADGMTEALITDLAKIDSLKVISRWSVMQYRGVAKPLPEIARELGVDVVVEGTVLRAHDRVRISAQLVEAATDRHLWAESYERELRDVLALQGEVARAIAREVRARVTPAEEAVIVSSRPVDPRAHDAYLKGLDYLDRAIRRGGQVANQTATLASAVEHFRHAAELEPDWAEAHARLSYALHFLASDSPSTPEVAEQRYARSKAEALRALELDETLADAHASLAFVLHRHEWDWQGAEREYRRALDLSPNDGHWGYGVFLRETGRYEESVREYRSARERNPQMPMIHGQLIRACACAGRIDDALREAGSFRELYPEDPLAPYWLGLTYLIAGRFEEAVAPLEAAATRVEGALPELGYSYARAGRTGDAEAVLRRLEGAGGAWFPDLYLALGREEEAFRQLEAALERRYVELLYVRCSPEFESLMRLPRFRRIYRATGLPDVS